MSAHPIFEHLFAHLGNVGLLPPAERQVAPMPACVSPQRELPDDRSDFTRDAEGTGA